MKKIAALISVIAAAAILYACGGSSSSTAPAVKSTQTPLTNKTEVAKTLSAAKALAASFSSSASFPSLGSLVGKPVADQTADERSVLTTVLGLQQTINGLVIQQKTAGKLVAAVTPSTCAGGGTRSYDKTTDPVVITLNGCVENGETRTGTVSVPQSLFQAQSTLIGGTIVADFSTTGYATQTDTKVTFIISSFNTQLGTANFSIDGTISTKNTSTMTSEKQTFGKFSLTMSESITSGITTTTIGLDGTFSKNSYNDSTFTNIATGSSVSFQQLKFVSKVDTTHASLLTLDGAYSIQSTPACMDGTFIFSTQKAIAIASNGTTTAGQLTVNGVDVTFNPDGGATATINGAPLIIPPYADACSLGF